MAEVFVNRIQFVFLILMACFSAYALYASRKRKEPFGTMRPISAMDHLEEAVGRAAEMGRSIFITQGVGTLDSASANNMLAGVSITGKVGELCAKLGVPIKVITKEGILQNLNETVLREAYAKAGVPEAYDPSMVTYGAQDHFAWANFCAQWIIREKPASAFFVGHFGGSSLYFSEMGARIGCFLIGGNYFVFGVTCDYFLAGEELFAAGAYASGDPEQTAIIAAEDIAKILILLLMIAGLAAALAGSGVVTQLLSW